jgi:hypothetical protein
MVGVLLELLVVPAVDQLDIALADEARAAQAAVETKAVAAAAAISIFFMMVFPRRLALLPPCRSERLGNRAFTALRLIQIVTAR